MTSVPAADSLARLVHEIGLRTYADRFLDLAEEREVLAIAGRVGVTNAEPEIRRICAENGTVREVDLRVTIRELLQREFGSAKIDEAGFHRVVGLLTTVIPMTDREKQKHILSVMEETGLANVKRGWFSNWHATLKQSLGLPG